MVKVVIEMSDLMFEMLCNSEQYKEPFYIDVTGCTPLPKGHGRLIDADELLISDEECGEIVNCIECKMYVETCEHFKATIEKAPTIIEADKEV